VENNFFTVISSILKLIKYQLSAAVAFSAAAGYIIFETEGTLFGLVITVTAVFFLSCGSAALNQYQERYTDALMQRTRKRPLPAHEIRSRYALSAALSLILTGTMILITFTSWLPAMLGLITVVLYNVVYTNLKRHTSLAIIPGALVGAIPPLIGFTAAGGSLIAPQALFLSGFMFMWQLPHFWLLLTIYRQDYERAGFGSLVKNPGQKDLKVIVPAWIVMMSIILLFAGDFGINIGQGLWFVLAGVNIAVTGFFLIILPKKEQIVADRISFAVLNSFALIVLTILIITAII
jgi:heme o synthase